MKKAFLLYVLVSVVALFTGCSDQEAYVYDPAFSFLQSYPQTIEEVYQTYGSDKATLTITEEDKRAKSFAPLMFTLELNGISFDFWGDSKEDAKLRIVSVTSKDQQNEHLKVIGMPWEDAKKMFSEIPMTRINDERILINSSNHLYYAVLLTDGKIVTGYNIIESP